ncbi:hypothetical protein [Streptomyces sp. NBC_01210]|uniref:hypothetical protein n=1 Tax=Streptomyces sp. NBC_01210 TaxID=2903774 RepID=UPI003FA37FCD
MPPSCGRHPGVRLSPFPPRERQPGRRTEGARYEVLQLTPDEREFVRRLGKRMMGHDIFYVGVDLAFPYVIEINMENPGGLNNHRRVTGEDRSSEAVNTVPAALRTAGKRSQAGAVADSHRSTCGGDEVLVRWLSPLSLLSRSDNERCRRIPRSSAADARQGAAAVRSCGARD